MNGKPDLEKQSDALSVLESIEQEPIAVLIGEQSLEAREKAASDAMSAELRKRGGFPVIGVCNETRPKAEEEEKSEDEYTY